jgi:chromate transporter
VILNLALFFAWHTWWPQGAAGGFDAVAAGLSLVAMIALMRYHQQALHVIAVCALLGLLAHSWV